MRFFIAGFVSFLSLHAWGISPLPGFTYMSPQQQNVVWKKLPIQICLSKDVPTPVGNLLSKAQDTWNKTFQRKIFTSGCTLKSSTFREEDSENHGVYWIKASFETFTDKTSLARTIVQYDDGGSISDADILLNGQYYDWQKLPIDAETVFLHELGHVLGLKHFFLDLNSAMNYFPYVSGYKQRSLGEYESIVFNTLYAGDAPPIPDYLKSYFAGRHSETIHDLEQIPTKGLSEFYALAVIYKAARKFDLAKKNFELVLAQMPQSALVRQQYADTLWSGGDNAGAEKEFLKTISIDPKNYESYANLGSLYLKKGETKKSIEFLKKSLSLQPAHWLACELLFEQTKEPKYQQCRRKFGPT